MQGESGLGEGLAVPVAPYADGIRTFLQILEILLHPCEGGVAACFDFGYQLALNFDICEHFSGIVIHGLLAAGDVHQSEILKSGKEFLLVCAEQDEGILGHFLDHSASSSSSAAWRVFTIFDEALLRFSSSSIYRLILRIAS